MITAALIPAAGRGQRMGLDIEKQFLQLGGKPLLAYTLAQFEATPTIDRIVVIVPSGRETFCYQEIVAPGGIRKVTHIVAGAETRQRSVMAGFSCLDQDVDVVVIHDGARPFVTPPLIRAAVDAALADGSAVAAIPESDTLKRVSGAGTVIETVDRRNLWRAQTPQAFRRAILQHALAYAAEHNFDATDEASLVEWLSWPVRIFPGSIWNFKVTSPDDLMLAELLLGQHLKTGYPTESPQEDR
jgi:2-C-methyl-D-erythritol 4-phosphate cytidylyltransferase